MNDWSQILPLLCSGFTFGVLFATRVERAREQRGVQTWRCRWIGHRWRRHLFGEPVLFCRRCPAELHLMPRRACAASTVVGVARESVERGQLLTVDLRSHFPPCADKSDDDCA